MKNIKKLIMKALFNTSAPKQWRYIEDTHERYIISTDGTVIDLKPQIGPLDEELREPREIDFQEQTDSYNINRKTKGIYPLLKKTFPEYYTVTEEEMEDLKQRAETQQSITYNVDLFNRLIFPNTLLTIYDTTCNKVQFFKNAKQKPSRVRRTEKSSDLQLVWR